MVYTNELYHHGVKGQRWGVRRYRNEDGSLTEAGKKHEAKLAADLERYRERELKSTGKYYDKQVARADKAVAKAYKKARDAYDRGDVSSQKRQRLENSITAKQYKRNAIAGMRALEMSKIKNMTVDDMLKEKKAVNSTIAQSTAINLTSAALMTIGHVPVVVFSIPDPRATKTATRVSSDEESKIMSTAIQSAYDRS